MKTRGVDKRQSANLGGVCEKEKGEFASLTVSPTSRSRHWLLESMLDVLRNDLEGRGRPPAGVPNPARESRSSVCDGKWEGDGGLWARWAAKGDHSRAATGREGPKEARVDRRACGGATGHHATGRALAVLRALIPEPSVRTRDRLD